MLINADPRVGLYIHPKVGERLCEPGLSAMPPFKIIKKLIQNKVTPLVLYN